MAQCVLVINGALVQDISPPDTCPGYVLLTPTDYQLLAPVAFTPADILAVWAWGFGPVVGVWALAYPVRLVLKAIHLL